MIMITVTLLFVVFFRRGRRLTSQGIRDMDRIAAQVQTKAKAVQE